MLLLKHCLWVCVASCAVAQEPAFEVASVKVSQADARARGTMRGGPGTSDPGQIAYTNVTIASVLLRAHNVRNYQLTAPDWMGTQRYDIQAKIPQGTTEPQFQAMLQNLLSERFHVVLHRENRSIQGFDLVTGRGGAKLKASETANEPPSAGEQGAAAGPPKTGPNGFPLLDRPGLVMMEGVRGKAVVSYLTAKAQPLSALVEMLSKEFRLPISDKTGLSAQYDFNLEFAPQPPGALTAAVEADVVPAATDDSAPNLVSAVQQQLGLKLTPGKVPLDVVVVERAERVPTAN